MPLGTLLNHANPEKASIKGHSPDTIFPAAAPFYDAI